MTTDAAAERRAKAAARSRAYRARHPDRVSAANKAWREANPEYRSEYRKKSLERVTEADRAYRRTHKDERTAYNQQWLEDHPEWAKAYFSAYRAAHSQERAAYNREYAATHKDAIAERMRAYNAARTSQRREYYQAYRQANAEKIAARMRDYDSAHKLERAVRQRNREAAKRHNGGIHTPSDITFLYEIQSGLCAYCGVSIIDGYHVDHVLPLSKGGSNALDNIVLTCPQCNMSKGSKTLDEWLRPTG